MYDLINLEDSDLKGRSWFWKLKIPYKFKTFLWLVFHKRLPTNQLKASRGIASSDLCLRCNANPEDLDHLFRGCLKVMGLWALFRKGCWLRDGLESPVSDWKSHNLKIKRISGILSDVSWSLLFAVSLWQIWKDRNWKSFDDRDIQRLLASKPSFPIH